MESSRESYEGFQLSPHQRSAWRWQLGDSGHQAGCALSLEGAVDPDRLEKALRQVVARHEALRTTFRQPSWMALPLQVIDPRVEVALERIESPAGRDGSREEATQDWLRRSRATPFDLVSGPVARFMLLSFSPCEHQLLIALPALVADPWTLDRLVAEVGDAYAGELNEAGEQPIQYVQYSEWQNGLLEEQEAEEGRAFWRAALAAPPLALPVAERAPRDRAAAAPFHPHGVRVPVDRRLAAELERLRRGVDLPDLLLACWHLLLWRVSGQGEVVVRRMFDGRKLEELRESLGLFAKYLPVKVDFGADLRLDELWDEARRAVADGSFWQEYFTEELIPGGEPFHPVLFGYEEQAEDRVRGGIRISAHSHYHYPEPFELRLWVVRRSGTLDVELQYDPRLFPAVTVLRLAGWYANLLHRVVRDPQSRASEVELLGEAERQQVLREWSESVSEAPPGDFLHVLFADQARRQPAAPAVVHGGVALTYGELDGQANRLARHLLDLGVGPEATVGILLERSVDLVVAILAVLKAGGAYVPLDPASRTAAWP